MIQETASTFLHLKWKFLFLCQAVVADRATAFRMGCRVSKSCGPDSTNNPNITI